MKQQTKPETEEQVQAKLEKARLERAARCFKKINEALESDKCVVNVYLQLGEQKVLAGSLINLPIEITIEAK